MQRINLIFTRLFSAEYRLIPLHKNHDIDVPEKAFKRQVAHARSEFETTISYPDEQPVSSSAVIYAEYSIV